MPLDALDWSVRDTAIPVGGLGGPTWQVERRSESRALQSDSMGLNPLGVSITSAELLSPMSLSVLFCTTCLLGVGKIQ